MRLSNSLYFLPALPEASAGLGVAPFRLSFRPSETILCWHSTLNILWPILIKLSIQFVYGKFYKPIYFQGHRSKVNVKFGNLIDFSLSEKFDLTNH